MGGAKQNTGVLRLRAYAASLRMTVSGWDKTNTGVLRLRACGASLRMTASGWGKTKYRGPSTARRWRFAQDDGETADVRVSLGVCVLPGAWVGSVSWTEPVGVAVKVSV